MRERLKERLQAKLRSGRGASITFALLLFLVCAVIGSVVLAAGTAASGRVSQLAEADRRYYAVTSAAQLFREELKDQSFTIVRTKTTDTPYYEVGLDLNGDQTDDSTAVVTTIEVLGSSEPSEYSYTLSDSGGSAITGNSLMAQIALELVFGGKTPETKDGWEAPFGGVSVSNWPKKLTVSVDGEADALAVDVKVELSSNGNITFIFTDQNEDDNEHYALSFTLSLQSGSNAQYGGKSTEKVSGKYIETETKTNRLSWVASDIGVGYEEETAG